MNSHKPCSVFAVAGCGCSSSIRLIVGVVGVLALAAAVTGVGIWKKRQGVSVSLQCCASAPQRPSVGLQCHVPLCVSSVSESPVLCLCSTASLCVSAVSVRKAPTLPLTPPLMPEECDSTAERISDSAEISSFTILHTQYCFIV
ncbi:UNVERIFIED_CONTAM: hypothetical protein FKN15_039111 [Acipenser sinensis]